ncbi:MAG: hypothetical protein QXU32_12805 [Nitrososphaerales archaeon]
MLNKAILAVALASILVFSMTASALAQQDTFSARLLVKGKKSNMLVLLVNSPASTQSIHQLELSFTKSSPVVAIARGWDVDKNGNTMTLTAIRGDVGPGGRAILIIRVSDLPSAAFDWKVRSSDGKELRSGTVSKIRVSEPSNNSGSVIPSTPEINVNKFTALPGEQITVTGKGYTPNSQIILYINQQEVGRSSTDASGTFNTVAIITYNIGQGLQMLRAVDGANKSSVIQIMIEAPADTGPPLQGGRLEVRVDKLEYNPGEIVRIRGSAVLERSVSVQVTDPKGGIVCGANPPVDERTLLWDTTCPLPNNAPAGRYTVEAKQTPHRTTAIFNVKGTTGGSGSGTGTIGEPGEDPGPLKISTDKQKYKAGEIAKITVQGARPQSLLDIIIDGPGSHLDYKRVTVDAAGSIIVDYPLTGSEAIGTWKISAKQKDAEQKKEFIVRMQFTVEN